MGQGQSHADDAFLAAVNPDNNTVSFFDTRSDVNRKLAEVPVQSEPNGVVMMPDGLKAYVANTVSGTVSVIPLNIRNGRISMPSKHIGYQVGSCRYDGNVRRGSVTIGPIANTGFKATGDAIARIPAADPGNPANFTFTTGAYPNQLNNIAIKGNFAYVPNVGASPNGPVRFDVNTHSLLSTINRLTNSDAGSINMHLAVKNQTGTPKLFNTLVLRNNWTHLRDRVAVTC